MKKLLAGVLVLLLAGALSSLSQEVDTLSSVHSWFSRNYSHVLLREDPVGTSGYGIRPLASRARTNVLTHEIFGYFPYWFRTQWNSLDYSLVSTIAYFSGEIASDGSVGNTHGWPKYSGDPAASADVINFINLAHTNGVRVVLCFTNFDANSVRGLVSDTGRRTRFLQEALSIVSAGGGDGVNIDFERVPSVSRDSLTLFMQVLADSFHTRKPGSQVSCAPTDYDTRQGDWDLPALQSIVDLFFFQGYGYHYSGSSTSGPVGLLPSSSFWGGLNITTLVSFVLSRISPEKVLLGLPHFGYRWPTAGPDAKSATAGSGSAIYYPEATAAAATYGRQWDAAGLSPWYRYQSGTQWYQGWYEDQESMAAKYQFALERNLMGVGMWALGQDGANDDLRDVLATYFKEPMDVARVVGEGQSSFRLYQNFPNPFNATTRIRYDVGGRGREPGVTTVRLAVHDLLGREVALLVSGPRPQGSYTVRFDASGLPSGVYICRMAVGDFALAERMIVLR